MFRSARLTTTAVLATAMLAVPSGASGLTKIDYAGPPKAQTKQVIKKMLGKSALAFLKTYFPAAPTFVLDTVTINQGDTVMWKGLSTGFHTVDLPGKSNHDLQLFVTGKTVTGVKDAAGSPFWFDGAKPSVAFDPQLNAQIGGKVYDGSTRVDSGSTNADTLKVRFTKAGKYKYFCDIHPGMVGYVVVRAKGKPIPSAKQDAASLIKQVKTILTSAVKLPKTKVPADHVDLGETGADGATLLHFFPSKLSVKAGTVVTFSIPAGSRIEGHTATFGPADYLTALSNSSSDASTQETAYPSSNPAAGPIQLDPSSHGNGFANTGWIDSDPTGLFPSSARIKFTTPGTYHFICLIHAFMTGTIVVH